MERLVVAQKSFEEATRKEQEIRRALIVSAKDEKESLIVRLKEAEVAKLQAEKNVKELRKAVLANAVPKRNEKPATKKWKDAQGNEHMIEYLII